MVFSHGLIAVEPKQESQHPGRHDEMSILVAKDSEGASMPREIWLLLKLWLI